MQWLFNNYRRYPRVETEGEEAIIIQPTPSIVDGNQVMGVTGRIIRQGARITQVQMKQSNYDTVDYTEFANEAYSDIFWVLSESTKELNVAGLRSFIDHTGDSAYTIVDVVMGSVNVYRQLVVNILRSDGSIVRSIHHTFKYSDDTIDDIRSQNHTISTYDHELGPKTVQELTQLQPSLWPRNLGPMANRVLCIERFLRLHTEPLTAANITQITNSKCPICLGDVETHECVRIKDVPNCEHMYGNLCLKKMLGAEAYDRKICPLCKTEFLDKIGLSETGFLEEEEAYRAIGARGMKRFMRVFRSNLRGCLFHAFKTRC